MSKNNYLTLGISAVVLIAVVVVLLMILLPQPSTLLEAAASKYEAIKKTEFTYQQTKDITREALVKEYGITSEQMDKFKRNNQYVSGNSDPFTPQATESTEESGNSTTNKNNNSGNNSNSNSNTSISKDTVDKITNSNGGQPNPPSTNK